MDSEPEFLLSHTAHDYESLIARWRAVAGAAGLTMAPIAEQFGHEVFGIRSQTRTDEQTGIYLCAGVHGDEPAGAEGLIAWAERNLEFLRRTPCMILPCLNPSGIVANTRHDAGGVDLNREFGKASHPLIAAWNEFLGGAKFKIGLCLHEDYDARGLYIYELGQPEIEVGEACLRACESIIPREPNVDIEGRPATNAVIRKTDEIKELAAEMEDGLPEAIYLRLHHAPITLTFETPSEYSLHTRVRAQIRFIETALAMAGIAK